MFVEGFHAAETRLISAKALVDSAEEFGKKVGDEETDALGFLHSSDPDFNVWWTAYPVRAPVIIGGRGGPQAPPAGSPAAR